MYLPAKEETVYTFKDSVIFKDSTVINEKQVYRDYTDLLDTLVLTASHSYSKAFVDTSKMILTGELVQEPIKTKYVTRTETVYKDSLIYKEIPIPYEVEKQVKYIPHIYKVSFYWLIFSVLMLIAFLFTKLNRKDLII